MSGLDRTHGENGPFQPLGGESHNVGELFSVVVFELEAYPEPKCLVKNDLSRLIKIFGSAAAVARHLDRSPAYGSKICHYYHSVIIVSYGAVGVR